MPRASVSLCLLLASCTGTRFGAPCVPAVDGDPAAREAALRRCFGRVQGDVIDPRSQRDLDVLFLIDNSASMIPKQRALAELIPGFIRRLDATAADYHLGVATSDVGALPTEKNPFQTSLGACDTLSGDDGVLQNLSCTVRLKEGAPGSMAAKQACAVLCPDPRFVPEGRFIARVAGATNVPREVVDGVDVGPQRAFQCVAVVGDAGCGIEGPMEAVRRALDGHRPENAGFLRPGSLLSVIMVTDEDDCSVSARARWDNDPATRECPVPVSKADKQCFNPDFRCLAGAVTCAEPLNAPGRKTGCVERSSSHLEPVATYVGFLSGLRPPSRLLLAGLWTRPALDATGSGFEVVLGPSVGAVNPMASQFLNAASGVGAACVSATVPEVTGKPQLRLSRLARDLRGGAQEYSICDVAGYGKALDDIAASIERRISAPCLSAAPAREGGAALCVVSEGPDDAAATTVVPACGAGCCAAWAAAAAPRADDPQIQAACAGEGEGPCHCAVESAQGLCPGAALAGVWRTAPLPAGRVTRFSCATGPTG